MANERKLIDYLPPFMQEYSEIQHIMDSEQPEVDFLWNEFENVLNNQFIQDATQYGVKRWESMLKIASKGTDTLEERKFRILSRLNQELPYTLTKLKEALVTLCGVGNFSIDLQAAKYHIEIKLALDNKNNYAEILDLLEQMIPANLTQNVQIMYNSNNTFKQFTHDQLTVYTHKQLREEVLD